jgi:hypothetical protein
MTSTPQAKPMNTNALELKDIHVPEQISDFPIAYGWWVSSVLLVILLVIIFINLRKSAKKNQVKKQALTQLRTNVNISISDTIALLKWAAMHYFSRAELAKLFGNSLQTFLSQQLPPKHQKTFIDLSEQAFINQYQVQDNKSDSIQTDNDLYQAATLWLTHALPPKTIKDTQGINNTDVNNKQGSCT